MVEEPLCFTLNMENVAFVARHLYKLLFILELYRANWTEFSFYISGEGDDLESFLFKVP